MSTTSVPESIESLRELCKQHPDDASMHMQLSELLTKEGREIGAIFAAREAYKIYSERDPERAEALLYQFGAEITAESNQPAITGNYLRLSDNFGAISTYMRTIELSEGQALFHQGEEADFIYLLLDGELAVHATNDGQFKLLNYLREGSLVGEAALYDEGPRTATVIANKPSTLLRLTPKELDKLLKKNARLNIKFAKESMLRKHVTLLTAAPIFSHLTLDLRYLVAKRTWNLCYNPGDIIKNAGEYMSHAALIIEGSVGVMDGEELTQRLVTGQMLGTRRLVELPASPLSFVAENQCKTVCMPFAVALDIMDMSPKFAREITNTVEKF